MKKILFACYLFAITALLSTQSYAVDIAPNWQLKTQDGQAISLDQLKGKPVILHFWATWCPYCKKLQPTLVAMQKKYQASEVTLIGISFNEDPGATPQDELIARGYDFMTAIGGDTIAERYGVVGTPTTFYINKKGEIVFKSTSSDTEDPRIELAIKEIIK
ncbi:TlpA family protein disulfide reductase [Thalassotalea atypica]|uniref:TlpA family protein disulfide reductase n=1 Tax=Thalassotalea atypica TaxID=2054316 RepID=UPI002572C385|nr:TlpA disulfide reductase family protein [Thalassotalea atypica]